MRIAGVNNNKNNQSFGYNHELNNELVKVLKKDNGATSKHLLTLNERCNEYEQTIKAQTKFRPCDMNGRYDKKTEVGLAVFAREKFTLAEAVETLFPQLNFARKEARQYKNEMDNDGLGWRDELIDMLNNIADEINPFHISSMQK